MNYYEHLAPSRRKSEDLGGVRRREPIRGERTPCRDAPRVWVDRAHHARVRRHLAHEAHQVAEDNIDVGPRPPVIAHTGAPSDVTPRVMDAS